MTPLVITLSILLTALLDFSLDVHMHTYAFNNSEIRWWILFYSMLFGLDLIEWSLSVLINAGLF